jgi:hypothetical protein
MISDPTPTLFHREYHQSANFFKGPSVKSFKAKLQPLNRLSSRYLRELKYYLICKQANRVIYYVETVFPYNLQVTRRSIVKHHLCNVLFMVVESSRDHVHIIKIKVYRRTTTTFNTKIIFLPLMREENTSTQEWVIRLKKQKMLKHL